MSYPKNLSFACEAIAADGTRNVRLLVVPPRELVIAGWTGRDAAAIQHHIDELQAIGVPPPSSVPLYYRVGANLLTQAASIEALGAETSGEAEPLLFFAAGEWWLSVGSDHTDRKVETYSVAVSKQVCAKPVATSAWRWADVAGYQDELELRSRIFEGGEWVAYQQGSFGSIRPLASLRDGIYAAEGGAEGRFMTCGTLGVIPNAEGEGIRPATEMEIEIRDPRLQRSIVHRYAVQVLEVVA